MSALYLASASPRRKELLAQLNVCFKVHPVNIPEVKRAEETATGYVERLAREKALAGLQQLPETSVVIGSDTIVVCGTEVMEKPADRGDFDKMMQRLSGQTHKVMTAVCVAFDDEAHTLRTDTEVTFRKLQKRDLDWYWNTGEPYDKAGGYGIQGLGGRFVERIKGSYSAVVGLPLVETEALLEALEFRERFELPLSKEPR